MFTGATFVYNRRMARPKRREPAVDLSEKIAPEVAAQVASATGGDGAGGAPASKSAAAPAGGGKVVVGAKVDAEVRDGLDAMARRLRAQDPAEPDNRSTSVRVSFRIAEAALRGNRLEVLSAMGRRSLADAVDEVLAAGFEVMGKSTR